MFAKRNLIALAALTVVSATAHADVNLYGKLDMSLGRKQTIDYTQGKKVSTTNVDSSDMSESFVGLRGSEDLGGGLKAVFKLESPLQLDTGTAEGGSTFWQKNAYVGLASELGTVTLGRVESLFKLESAAFNPFGGSSTFSPSARLGLGFGQLGVAIDQLTEGAVDLNLPGVGGSWANTVAYASPNLGGLTVSAQYSAKESAKSSSTSYGGGAYALSANYAAGPFAASVVFGDVKSTDATASDLKDRAFLLGTSYDFGILKGFVQYGEDKFTQKGETGSVKPKFYQVGLHVPVSEAGAVLVSYGQTKLSIDEVSLKTNDFSLGYTHTLSKRTNVYGAWINEKVTAKIEGQSDANKSTNNYSVGVRHAF
jgi:predicted porin